MSVASFVSVASVFAYNIIPQFWLPLPPLRPFVSMSGRTQSRSTRLGRLLLPRPDHRCLSDDQCTRPVSVPQVVDCQTQERPSGWALEMESLAGAEVWPARAEMGLQPLAACESVNLLREPDAGDPHVRF